MISAIAVVGSFNVLVWYAWARRSDDVGERLMRLSFANAGLSIFALIMGAIA